MAVDRDGRRGDQEEITSFLLFCFVCLFVNGLKAKVTRSSMRTKAVWPVVVGVASRAALFEDTTSGVADQHATHSTGLEIIGFFF